jgi:acetate kinase
MKPANPRILTINGGSSSIKFALFEAGDSPRRILAGGIERIGLPDASLRVKGVNQADNFSRLVTAPNHTVAVDVLMDWIEERGRGDGLTAVGIAWSMAGRGIASRSESLRKWLRSCDASFHSILTICRRRSC